MPFGYLLDCADGSYHTLCFCPFCSESLSGQEGQHYYKICTNYNTFLIVSVSFHLPTGNVRRHLHIRNQLCGACAYLLDKHHFVTFNYKVSREQLPKRIVECLAFVSFQIADINCSLLHRWPSIDKRINRSKCPFAVARKENEIGVN